MDTTRPTATSTTVYGSRSRLLTTATTGSAARNATSSTRTMGGWAVPIH